MKRSMNGHRHLSLGHASRSASTAASTSNPLDTSRTVEARLQRRRIEKRELRGAQQSCATRRARPLREIRSLHCSSVSGPHHPHPHTRHLRRIDSRTLVSAMLAVGSPPPAGTLIDDLAPPPCIKATKDVKLRPLRVDPCSWPP